MTANNLYQDDLPDNLDLTDQVAIDTEAMGLDNKRDRLCLIQLSSGNGSTHLVQIAKDKKPAPNLCKLLEDKNILKIFHYARFDVAILQNHFNIKVQNTYCTKIASKLARTYSDSHGLKTLISEFLKIDISKKQQSSDWGAATISKEQIKYAACDVLYLHRLKDHLNVMLLREGRLSLAQKCFNFINNRVELDLEGFKDDIFSH